MTREELVERIRLQINEADIFKLNVEIARAILFEIAAAGLQIVPKAGTNEMILAMQDVADAEIMDCISSWNAALAAAPDYHGGGK